MKIIFVIGFSLYVVVALILNQFDKLSQTSGFVLGTYIMLIIFFLHYRYAKIYASAPNDEKITEVVKALFQDSETQRFSKSLKTFNPLILLLILTFITYAGWGLWKVAWLLAFDALYYLKQSMRWIHELGNELYKKQT